MGDDGLVKDLEVRLAALDPDASAAVRVIAYFDKLTESGAGLEAIVRGAAVLTGYPARLTDEERRLSLRVEPDGAHRRLASAPDQSWPRADVGPEGGATLWLEFAGSAGPVDAMVLERAAAAARVVLARTPGRASASGRGDRAAVGVLIDGGSDPGDRRHAARVLGVARAPALRAVALATPCGIEPAILAEPAAGAYPAPGDDRRAGIGTAADLDGLPMSWAAARTALRFTAAGTSDDPGPRSVRYDELGGLVLLAGSAGPGTPMIPDEAALDRAAAAAPWILVTLYAVATSVSLRAAAAGLLVHHSTLQERVEHAERLLGWPVRDPHGRHRLYLALVVRRLRRNS
jgi:PucR C-terminal helix-turn-helix domain